MSAVLADIRRATLDDLMRYDGKAELIGGRIVPQMASGRRPNIVAGRIYASLLIHSGKTGIGEAYTDNMGFAVSDLLSDRESFSPDVSFATGPFPDNEMGFNEGAPDFAVEVRSENDYGGYAESKMAEKRADYFEAGTKVVWDVDPVDNLILAYSANDPENPRRFVPGDTADAELAVPGWRLDVASTLK